MPQIDLTVTISVILALAAIVSPIATALINNAHHTKIRKMELEYEEKRNSREHVQKIFDSYLSNAGAYIRLPDGEHAAAYGSVANLAFCYAPEEARKTMEILESQIDEANNGIDCMMKLNKIAVILKPKSKQLPE